MPTHKSGSGIDLVFASRCIYIQNLAIHDGCSCACPANSCCPALASDHKFITLQVLVSTTSVDSKFPRWPIVRDWALSCILCPQLLDWTTKVREFMRFQSWRILVDRRAILDFVYGDLVMLLGNSCRDELRVEGIAADPLLSSLFSLLSSLLPPARLDFIYFLPSESSGKPGSSTAYYKYILEEEFDNRKSSPNFSFKK